MDRPDPRDIIIKLDAPPVANDSLGGRLSGKEHAELSADIASMTRRTLPEGVGCLIITYDYASDGFMGYASTGDRAQCLRLLREFIRSIERGGL